MNPHRATRAVALLVVCCMLVVGGLASAQSIAHESHHAHHQKATHGTVLCSWMCAAGQVLDGIPIVPSARFSPLAFEAPITAQTPQAPPLAAPASRSPPSL